MSAHTDAIHGAGVKTISEAQKARGEFLFQESRQATYRRVDRLFAVLMSVQWVAGILGACPLRRKLGLGNQPCAHPCMGGADLGGIVTIFPVSLALLKPGEAMTRYTIAASQMMMSALLIHLSGGRIETHFHIFGSLAFLAFYRDWRVFIPATLVVAGDHFVRGIFFPESAFGVQAPSPWRWVEHAGWVLFGEFLFDPGVHPGCQGDARERGGEGRVGSHAGSGGGGEPGQERVPGQHEP